MFNNYRASDNTDLEKSIRSYIRMCKTSDTHTVRQVINGLRSKYNHRVIARNNCISVNTINRVGTLYDHVGGATMSEIADKLCMRGGTDQYPKKKKSVEENIDTFNKGIESTNKAIDSASKAADLTVATATAITRLFNNVSATKNMIDDANVTTKDDVVKDIIFLKEQLAIKDALLAKKNEELAEANRKLQTALATKPNQEIEDIIKVLQQHQIQIQNLVDGK